jgi:protein ImuB
MRILCLRLQVRAGDEGLPTLDRPRIAAALEEFSPRIGWLEHHGDYCFCLDITATARWFGGEANLLDCLRSWCHEERLAATAVIADTVGAAWAVAYFGFAGGSSTTFDARIIAAGQTIDAVSHLPVESLRLPQGTVRLLCELGIDVVAPLFHLPREALAERFDSELLDRLDQVTGDLPELFEPYRPEPCYSAERTWEHGIATAEPLFAIWVRLLPKALGPLVVRGRGVGRLLAELSGETGSLCRLVIGLVRPTLDPKHLLDLLRLRLESVRLREPIVATRLAVLDEAPFAIQQQVLFNELAPPIESEAWTSLIERLSGRIGATQVVRILPHADHDPARAWKAVPWIVSNDRPTPKRHRPSRAKTTPTLPRPMTLLPVPRPVYVLNLAPHGHPGKFVDRGRESLAVHSWGPERIETGWWRGPSLRRDYYRVETEAGSHAWLFRDLRSRRWFLHGWFD